MLHFAPIPADSIPMTRDLTNQPLSSMYCVCGFHHKIDSFLAVHAAGYHVESASQTNGRLMMTSG